MNTYSRLGTFLGIGDTEVNKTSTHPYGLYIQGNT